MKTPKLKAGDALEHPAHGTVVFVRFEDEAGAKSVVTLGNGVETSVTTEWLKAKSGASE